MSKIECFADLLNRCPIPADVINDKGDVEPEIKYVSLKNNGLDRVFNYELRRLNSKYIQEQRRKTSIEIPILSVSDEIIGWRDEWVIAEGRIRCKRHSYDRIEYKRYGDFRTRSILVLSTMKDAFNAHEFIDMTTDGKLDESDEVEADWESLKRVNTGWREPTIASIASSEFKRFAIEG